MTVPSSPLILCAAQELTLAVRSRATQIFALVFAALALAVSAAGYILSGGSGVQDFARTATSLTQLVLFVVPLMALVLGTTALSSDRGAAEVLFSQPVPRRTLLWGRLLGLFAALTAAQALGFGASGLVIFSQSGGEGLTAFLLLIAGALALTAVFLSVAALIAGAGDGRRRSRAVATRYSSGSRRPSSTTSSRWPSRRSCDRALRPVCSSSPRSPIR